MLRITLLDADLTGCALTVLNPYFTVRLYVGEVFQEGRTGVFEGTLKPRFPEAASFEFPVKSIAEATLEFSCFSTTLEGSPTNIPKDVRIGFVRLSMNRVPLNDEFLSNMPLSSGTLHTGFLRARFSPSGFETSPTARGGLPPPIQELSPKYYEKDDFPLIAEKHHRVLVKVLSFEGDKRLADISVQIEVQLTHCPVKRTWRTYTSSGSRIEQEFEVNVEGLKMNTGLCFTLCAGGDEISVFELSWTEVIKYADCRSFFPMVGDYRFYGEVGKLEIELVSLEPRPSNTIYKATTMQHHVADGVPELTELPSYRMNYSETLSEVEKLTREGEEDSDSESDDDGGHRISSRRASDAGSDGLAQSTSPSVPITIPTLNLKDITAPKKDVPREAESSSSSDRSSASHLTSTPYYSAPLSPGTPASPAYSSPDHSNPAPLHPNKGNTDSAMSPSHAKVERPTRNLANLEMVSIGGTLGEIISVNVQRAWDLRLATSRVFACVVGVTLEQDGTVIEQCTSAKGGDTVIWNEPLVFDVRAPSHTVQGIFIVKAYDRRGPTSTFIGSATIKVIDVWLELRSHPETEVTVQLCNEFGLFSGKASLTFSCVSTSPFGLLKRSGLTHSDSTPHVVKPVFSKSKYLGYLDRATIGSDWEKDQFGEILAYEHPPGVKWNHVHVSYDTVIQIVRGEVEFEVGKIKYSCTPGDELIIFSNTPYTSRNVGQDKANWWYAYRATNIEYTTPLECPPPEAYEITVHEPNYILPVAFERERTREPEGAASKSMGKIASWKPFDLNSAKLLSICVVTVRDHKFVGARSCSAYWEISYGQMSHSTIPLHIGSQEAFWNESAVFEVNPSEKIVEIKLKFGKVIGEGKILATCLLYTNELPLQLNQPLRQWSVLSSPGDSVTGRVSLEITAQD